MYAIVFRIPYNVSKYNWFLDEEIFDSKTKYYWVFVYFVKTLLHINVWCVNNQWQYIQWLNDNIFDFHLVVPLFQSTVYFKLIDYEIVIISLRRESHTQY